MSLAGRKAPVNAFDVERVRSDFPILGTTVRGKPLVYLDNAATSQKPRAVIDALSAYYTRQNANVHRGVYQLSVDATRLYEGARERVRSFLNAETADEIVFVRGTTEAINLVARSFLRPRLSAGDEILLSAMEHHSNIVPWQLAAKDAGARIRVIPMNERGELLQDEYLKLLGDKTKLVALTHVSNALGTVNPVRDMIAAAHERDIPVLLDGAQAAAHVPVDVRALDADFYAVSAHKAYGPTGVGALYGKTALLADMPPTRAAGT